MSLLEQDTTKKRRVSKEVLELNASNKDRKEYKLETIWNSAVYANKLELGYLPSLYYLVAYKGYPKEENTWEPLSAVKYFKKLINSFYKNLLEKPIATSLTINSAQLMTRPTVKLT